MLSRRALIGGGFAALVAVPTASAQSVPLDPDDPADAAIDSLAKAAMAGGRIPALSLAVVKNGVVKCAAYGMADREKRIQATTDTAFHIASLGKQFVATGIMLLVEDGKLRLDDKAVNYLQNAPASWREITVRHLLTHTSGLRRGVVGYDPAVEQSDATLIELSYRRPLVRPPGSGYGYSNLGYFVLAEIIRVVTRQPWSNLIETRVFQRAGLTMTRPTNRTDGLPRIALGYKREHGHWIAAPLATGLRPSGAFVSTVEDLARWHQVLRTDRVLGETSREAMFSRARLNNRSRVEYGFGWGLGPSTGTVLYAKHRGHPTSGGFRSAMRRYLTEDLAVIVLTNSHHTVGVSPECIVRVYRASADSDELDPTPGENDD
jgi:CubicO group peptidase (beta-lactamase class C family)